MNAIPLFDCRLRPTAVDAVKKPFLSGHLAAGPAVAQLEQYFDERFNGHHAVAVSDMTNALALALKLANVRHGDEVLSLSFNCMSSNAAISMAGAQAVWVDIDPTTASFDAEHARTCITSRTKAVIIYHVSGYPAQIAEIKRFCDEHGLVLIEDANNAFGGAVDNQAIGMFGDFAVFSLYANRQINAIDGGILLCKHQESAEHARRLRRFGLDLANFRDRDGEIDPLADVAEVGTSAALNNINATLGLLSTMDVDIRIARSRKNASALAAITGHKAIRPILPVTGGEPVYWTWLILLSDRDRVMRDLKAGEIMCSKLHYPNHHYTGFSAKRQKLPGTAIFEERLLAVPCGWWIDDEAISRIGQAIDCAVNA